MSINDEEEAEDQLLGWEEFFEQIGHFLRESERHFGNCSGQYAGYVVDRLQLCIRSCSILKDHFDDHMVDIQQVSSGPDRDVILKYTDDLVELMSCLRELSREWLRFMDVATIRQASVAYSASASHNSKRGRPRFEVSSEQIEYLHSLCFSWTDIASLLGVSRMTLYRRRQEFGLLSDQSATLDNDSLKRVLSELRQEHPDIGEKMVIGRLRSMGYRVCRARVREVIRETDPINTALRWQGVKTSRRQYCVPGPNSLWHIGEYSELFVHAHMHHSYVIAIYDVTFRVNVSIISCRHISI